MNQFNKLNKKRIQQRLDKLSKFTLPKRPWTRRAFTEQYAQARDWLRKEMKLAGLATRLDAGANLIGSSKGSDPKLGILATGSHIDTVMDGGRYDGILGVVASLEAAQVILESGIKPHHTLEVIDFLSEEPSDYGISCIGSRAMSGNLSKEHLKFTNPSGESLSQAIQRVGGKPKKLGAALRSKKELAAFLELHIEQGKILETANKQIGVVNNIVGIRRYEIVITGRADHSGTTPMNARQDALVGAAKIIEKVNSHAKTIWLSNNHLVATVGKISVLPNASNAVPGEVRFSLEIRSDNQKQLDNFLNTIIQWAKDKICKQDQLRIQYRPLSIVKPIFFTKSIINQVAHAATSLGLSWMNIKSGAGHDAGYMANLCPSAMIFVPCYDGRSHCPEENITIKDAMNGANVLTQSLLLLDRNKSYRTKK